MNKRAQPLADDPVDLEDRMADIREQVNATSEERIKVVVLGLELGTATDWDQYGTEIGSVCFFGFVPSEAFKGWWFPHIKLEDNQDRMLIIDRAGMTLEVWELRGAEPKEIVWTIKLQLCTDTELLFTQVEDEVEEVIS